MTDQMVSQRCRLQARRLVAQRSQFLSPGPVRNTSNRQAQRTVPYASIPIKHSPEWQCPPPKKDNLLTDIATEECSQQGCYAKEPHTHQEEKVSKLKEQVRYSPEVEPPPTGQLMLSPKTGPNVLACVDPNTNAGMLRANLETRLFALRSTKCEDLNSALRNLAISNDSMQFSRHNTGTADIVEVVEMEDRKGNPGCGDWHATLTIRPSPSALDQDESLNLALAEELNSNLGVEELAKQTSEL